jgi:CBS domain-containing protein
MKVQEIMVQPVVTVREGTSLEEVARLLLDRRIGGVPVVDGRGNLCGIVTESDFVAKDRGFPFSPFSLYRHPQVLGRWLPKEGVEQIYRAARTMTAEEVMTTNVVTVTEDDPVEEAMKRMLRHEVHRTPVVRGGVPVGMVTRHDLLQMMLGERELQPEYPPAPR